jgi:PAS domain S-box-containing protein
VVRHEGLLVPSCDEEIIMKPDDTAQPANNFPIKRLRLTLLFAWTLLAMIAAVWEYHDNKAFMTANALLMARTGLEKDIIFRRWAAGHGGVYVPVTDKTPPNPWLNVPERDISTPSGRRLTLMNPAYMTRQLFEIGQLSVNAPQGHITSLKPIRPENRPDPWESRVLASFETGQTEFGEFIIFQGKPVYRYMHPLMTEKTCLKCHGAQGFTEGTVRGGISIAIPTAGLERSMVLSNINHTAIIVIIWLMGLGGIGLGFRKINTFACALTTERNNLSAVFDASPMPMLLIDDRMLVVRANSAFRDYCINYDSLSDKRCGALLKCANAIAEPNGCGTTPSCMSCNLLRALREGLRSGLTVSGEATIVRNGPNGSRTEAWVIFGVEAVSLAGRSHVLLSFMDITGRKHIEEQLAAREQEFRALVENSPDPIARYDRHCRRVYVNPALELLTGKSADLLTGKTPTEAFVGNPAMGQQIQDAIEQVLNRGVALEIEVSTKDSGNVLRNLQIRYVPEFDLNKNVTSVLGITRDITSLRTAETQLLQAQKMESIGTLAGGVAHDFNNVLAVIGGYAEILRLSLKDDDRKLGFVREIADSVNRGAELTRSLLTFSGKHEPQMQHNDLNQIVANLQKSMSRLLRSDITLTFGLCENQLPVFADRFQIEQVLINLMVNARDALTSGGRIDITSTLVEVSEEIVTGGTTVSPGSYGLVSVADNGIGMDEDTIKRIFEPFFTTKETGKGTGLGLAIAFGIVGNHHGHIAVQSSPGKGSMVGVYLPICTGNRPPIHLPEHETATVHGNETVLLVDDDQTVLNITQELLESYGYTVLTAVDGVEALEVFAEHRDEIRMVISDMIMPRMNGRAAIERIRQQKQDLPIILMSGYTDDNMDRATMDALNVVFLPKPVLPQSLAAAIRAGLEN